MRDFTGGDRAEAEDHIGLDEVAAMLGVRKETALRYVTRPDFPAPVEGL